MALPRLSGPAALLTLLLLGACDSDAANLAKEITDARGDCTQEKLKASDTACVQMMEKYAAIGTSAIETYIGAVKSMDQALQRMPPANFDTTGFGHALTPASAADSLGSFGGYGAARTGARDPRGGSSYDSGYDPRYSDPRYSDPRYSDPQYSDPRYDDPQYSDPRSSDPRYPDPRDGDAQYSGRRYPDAGGADPRDPGRGDPGARYADPRSAGAERGDYGNGAAPLRRRPESSARDGATSRATPAPGRGLLLPPDQRLERPWLRAPEDAEPREAPDRANMRPRAERPDGYLPSYPLPADTLGPYDEDRPRTRRPEGY